jgi:predicted permease
VVLAGLGGPAGLVLGTWVLKALLPLLADILPRAAVVGIDARAAAFAIGAALAIGAVLGLVVAMQRPRGGLVDALKAGARTLGAPRASRMRNTLVVSQVAFAVVLLVAAGLMLGSLVRLSRVSTGFDPEHVLTFRLALPQTRYESAAARTAAVDGLIQHLAASPGITGVAVNSRLPFGGTRGGNGILIEGRPRVAGEILIADQREVTPDYFSVMTIPLVSGRLFTSRDSQLSEPVAVVNRTMATRFWPGGSPLGARVQLSGGPGEGQWMRIVGIVDDVRHVALNRPPVPEMYRPYSQRPSADFMVTVKTAGEPAAAGRMSRAAVASIDADLPVYDMRTMEERISSSVVQTRATMLLLVVTAALAAALASIAIYGSIWYSVTERIPEIGVRLALGATPSSVFRDIVARAMALSSVGVVLGAAATRAAAPMLEGLLFETRLTDPITYVGVAVVLGSVSLAASVAPARRAMRIDPMTALRN